MLDPDAALVLKAGRGDARAVEALVKRHLSKMTGLARRMLGDPAEAEDVAQEVFLRVWREAPKWRPGSAKFETWMHRVALNLCYDRLRRKRETPVAEAGLTVVDGAPSPAQAWQNAQTARAVQAALAALPERQRAAITLCSFLELSNIEAAATLEVSVEALESLLSRGRRAMKAALFDRAGDLLGAVDPEAPE